MRESAVLFGEAKSLVGIVTDPADDSNDLGFVFLNAGFTHRVGPQRMSVEYGRRLSQMGYTVLRFDHSGIGDSRRRADSLPFPESAVKDAREAMSFLHSTRGIDRFVISGVCWGADNAVRVCDADPRVVGVVAIDFYSMPSLRHLLRVYPARLLAWRSWLNILTGKSGLLRQVKGFFGAVLQARSSRGGEESADVLPAMRPGAVMSVLERMVERGAHLCFAFASGAVSYDQYMARFRKGMRRLEATGRVRVRVFPAADHLFTLRYNKARLWEYVAGWAGDMAREFGREAAGVSGGIRAETPLKVPETAAAPTDDFEGDR